MSQNIKHAVTLEHNQKLENTLEMMNLTQSFVECAHNKCEGFYRHTLLNSLSIFVTDRDGIDTCTGRNTSNWVVGVSHSKGVYLLDPRLYDKESNKVYSEISFGKTITHEIGHKYFSAIHGMSYKESNFIGWFNEGTQMYLAGQNLNVLNEPFDKEALADKYNQNVYKAGTQVIRAIVKKEGNDAFKVGVSRILNDLRNTPSRKPEILEGVFSASFEEAFGIKPEPDALEVYIKDVKNIS